MMLHTKHSESSCTGNCVLSKWVQNQSGQTQIIHFIGGEKRTYDGVNVNSIRQGQFTKFECKNGAMVLINDRNVLMIEVFAEED